MLLMMDSFFPFWLQKIESALLAGRFPSDGHPECPPPLHTYPLTSTSNGPDISVCAAVCSFSCFALRSFRFGFSFLPPILCLSSSVAV